MGTTTNTVIYTMNRLFYIFALIAIASAMSPPKKDGGCKQCVEEFVKADGCEAMMELTEDELMEHIPKKCQKCGDEAGKACMKRAKEMCKPCEECVGVIMEHGMGACMECQDCAFLACMMDDEGMMDMDEKDYMKKKSNKKMQFPKRA